jgi:hypothetical protein
MAHNDNYEEYREYSVIWDGALDETFDVDAEGIIDGGRGEGKRIADYLDELEQAANEGESDSRPMVEIYSVYHAHSREDMTLTDEVEYDCECSQFETSHAPDFVFGRVHDHD